MIPTNNHNSGQCFLKLTNWRRRKTPKTMADPIVLFLRISLSSSGIVICTLACIYLKACPKYSFPFSAYSNPPQWKCTSTGLWDFGLAWGLLAVLLAVIHRAELSSRVILFYTGSLGEPLLLHTNAHSPTPLEGGTHSIQYTGGFSTIFIQNYGTA